MASFGIFLCVLVAAISIAAAGGYLAGQRERELHATATTVVELDVQYQIGLSDLQAGQYGLAAQRFRWIIARAPDYPGVAISLAQAEASLKVTATPQPTLQPSTGSSPDTLFAEAKGFYDSQQWSNAITRLHELETADPGYRADEVKAMLFNAQVTLGLQYLRGDRLEEGIVLLQQAEQIQALDDQAAGERNLARLYLTGRTYEVINWGIAIKNYEAIYAIAPNYRDVKTRLLAAYLKFADQLIALGGHCDAAQLLQKALGIKQADDVQAKFNAETAACAIPTPTPPGGVTVTPGGPTVTPYSTSSTGAIPPGFIPPGTTTTTP
jgi:tetratricopeptide (TPR) repeat protein